MKLLLLALTLFSFQTLSAGDTGILEVECRNFEGQTVVQMNVEYDYPFYKKGQEPKEFTPSVPTISSLNIQNVGLTIKGGYATEVENELYSDVKPLSVSFTEKKIFKGQRIRDLDIELPELFKVYNGGNWSLKIEQFYIGDYISASEFEEEGGFFTVAFSTGSDERKLLCKAQQ